MALARETGWSEAEILALPAHRFTAYLNLLAPNEGAETIVAGDP